ELRMTGFAPSAAIPEFPPGDPYPYGHYNLDAPNATLESRLLLADGGTKFEHARQDAIAASRIFLRSVMENVTGAQQADLMGATERLPPSHVPIPGFGAPVACVGVAALLAVAWRRHAGTQR